MNGTGNPDLNNFCKRLLSWFKKASSGVTSIFYHKTGHTLFIFRSASRLKGKKTYLIPSPLYTVGRHH